jgi:hypothetical protein
VIAAAVFHDSSRAHQDLQDRAVLSLDLVSLPLGDAVSRQDKNLVNRLSRASLQTTISSVRPFSASMKKSSTTPRRSSISVLRLRRT